MLKERLQEVRAAFQRSEGDMGSSEVQGAPGALAAVVCSEVQSILLACWFESHIAALTERGGTGVCPCKACHSAAPEGVQRRHF